jgi:hypothetical protein
MPPGGGRSLLRRGRQGPHRLRLRALPVARALPARARGPRPDAAPQDG